MEEKDRNLPEPDEDRAINRSLNEQDEGDDVEAHRALNRTLNEQDEGDDDVEAHRALN